MTILLRPADMLGHWTDRNPKVCEFQQDSTMIYVEYDGANPMQQRLAVAQASIDAAFSDFSRVLAYAEGVSSLRHPDFWKNARRIPLRQHPLAVFCVRYTLESDSPSYEVSWNPDFVTEEGVAYSNEWIEENVRVELPQGNDFIHIAPFLPSAPE